MTYTVKFYTGPYSVRQRQANADKAIVYIEHHFNGSSNPHPDYTCAIVSSNSSRTSRRMAMLYAGLVAKEFGTQVHGDNGVVIGGFNGRGDGNIKRTAMPAMLVEPMFASNPAQAAIIKSQEGQTRLAKVLVDTIVQMFPDGGLVAFSVGHKYKSRSSKDRGVPVLGGGWEADYAEKVLKIAENLLDKHND